MILRKSSKIQFLQGLGILLIHGVRDIDSIDMTPITDLEIVVTVSLDIHRRTDCNVLSIRHDAVLKIIKNKRKLKHWRSFVCVKNK